MIKTEHRIIQDDFYLSDDLTNINPCEHESVNLRAQLPIEWHKAKDCYVYDESGNKWIDMTAGIFAANAGHSNPAVNKAIKEQLDSDLSFSFFYPTKIRNQLAKKILDVSPDYFEKVILLNTGSEATDMAYKMIKMWAKRNNKKYIICFKRSYHGRTLSSDFMSGDAKSTDWSNLKDDDVVFIKFPYRGEDFDPSELVDDPSKIAAFFIETYQGWGAWMYPDNYIKNLYDFAREHGALVCFDEVQAGLYRMGELYGYMSYGDYIKPDIICLGKGLSSPMPMSAVLSTTEMIDNTTKIGGTHAGNPLCCAATIANVDFLTDPEFQESLSEKVKVFEKRFGDLIKYESIDTINVKGMVAGIIFHDPTKANEVVVESVRNGVMPVNTWSTSIKIGPPLTISVDAINEAADVIEECIKNVSRSTI